MADAFDIAVIGGGLAGATAALAFARAGRRVAFVAPPTPTVDGRTTALMMPAIGFLEKLAIWQAIEDQAAPLRTMRIIDGTKRLFRAPTVAFHAAEIGEDAFGYNIPNAVLLDALYGALDVDERVIRFEKPAETVDIKSDPAIVTLADDKTVACRMIVAADGRKSVARAAAGIETRNWSYPQSAVVLTFRHSLPHGAISTEFHTEAGPFTQVPLPGDRSSLVWVMRPEQADAVVDLPDRELDKRIETQMQSMLGKIEIDSRPQQFPLSGMVARAFGSGVVALVGEAGHVFPPIGAQGLNLGMRDVAILSEEITDTDSRATVETAIARYDRKRRADVRARTNGVDLLNRSLLSDFLPTQIARMAGLSILSSANPLRSFALREGMKPGSALRGLSGALREKIRR